MKRIFAVCVLISIAVLGFSASPEMDVYSQIYDSAQTQQEKLGILQTIIEEKIDGAGEFYAKALHALVLGYGNIRGSTEINAANEQAIILSSQVGTEKQTGSAEDLWRVVQQFPFPLARAEALMSLGKIQAKAYLPQVITLLRNINIRAEYKSDNLSGERVAYGAIISLEKLADPSAYLEVYNASKAWYSDRIKSQAVKSLPVVSSDPGPYLKRVIQTPGDYAVKLAALQSIEASGIPNDNKADIAAASLNEAWKAVTADVALQSTLRQIRTLAMTMITKYGAPDTSVYPLLGRCYNEAPDINEKLTAVQTLAALASDDSARLLTGFLTELNTKRQRGNINQQDEQLIRAVIPALGTVKKPIARPELNRLKSLGWADIVKRLADDALKSIPSN
jgi:hypothetical protein